MKEKRDSVLFYQSFYESIRNLPEEYQLKVYDAICRYGICGEEVELEGVPLSIFLLIKPQIDANIRKYDNGNKGGRPSVKTETKPNDNQDTTEEEPRNNQTETKPEPKNNQTETKPKPNDNLSITKPEPKEKDKEKDKDKVKEKGNKREYEGEPKRFSPPTLLEIESYCKERNNKVNPERFYDFYESKGWYVGKNKMKDWRACVRTWEMEESEKKQSFIDAGKHEYTSEQFEAMFTDLSDIDAIEV